MTSEQKNLCILVAEVCGHEALLERPHPQDAQLAMERCLNRIDRVIDTNGGERLGREPQRLAAGFPRCDAAVLAACEMLDRVASMPPVSGVQVSARIGVHFGPLDIGWPAQGIGLDIARRLAASAQPGQALASPVAVAQLSTSARHFAASTGVDALGIPGIDGPILELSHRLAPLHAPTDNPLHPAQQLRVRLRNTDAVVDEHRPVLLLGREQGNDLVIIDRRASRQHARIERRPHGFYLIDQSSNGSFVELAGQHPCILRQGEMLIDAAGRLGCGFSCQETDADLVFFELHG